MTDSPITQRLPNGLRLVVSPMADRLSATVAVYIGVGSRYESEAEAGSSHLIEHMLFKGTERRPNGETISEEIEAVGGSMNASTDKEATVYWAKVASDDLPLAIDLLGDMVLHSRFEADELRKEKHVVAEELGMAMDTPQDWIHTLVEAAVWPEGPLGRDVAGTRQSVARLTRAGLLRYRQRHYTPQAAVVSVAGRVDQAAVYRLVDDAFGSWSGAAIPVYAPGAYPAQPPLVRLERRETEQTNLCLAVRGIAQHDPRRYAFDLLNMILGGGMSSRLFVEVRERRALVYDIHSYTERLDDTGMLAVYAGMDPSSAPIVVGEIISALRRMRDEPVSAAELNRVKSQYRGRLVLGLEDTSSVASWNGAQELVFGGIQTPAEVLESVYAVQAADLQQVAIDMFRDDYLRLAVIGPHADAARFEELLTLS